MTAATNSVLVSAARLDRWIANFGVRHGDTALTVADGHLLGRALDGSTFVARLPFDTSYDGPATAGGLSSAAVPPGDWGVLLVRKGGFAVARMAGERMVGSKVGRRHVQGRTKAGGQSQQRFARRRDNQARQAYEAAAEHAARILAGAPLVVTGGDRGAVEAVLADPRLRGTTPAGPWLPVPDPRRGELERAVLDAQSLRIDVANAS